MPVGKVGPFDLVNDNWELYVDRLEQYFVANDVKNEMKVATLITVMGGDAYELMVNLCTPVKPATKTYDQLVALMKGHLNPKPSLLAERFKFRQRVQKRDESIANFVTDLKKLSKDCGFTGDTLKDNLRDQFVCGLSNDDIRQKLFTEDDTITFDRAYKLAVSMEAAEVNAALVEDCTRNRSSDSIPASAATSVHHLGRAGRGRAAADGGRAGAGTAGRGKITIGGGPSAMSGAGSGKMRGFGQNNNTDLYGVCKVCGAKHEADRCKFKKYVCRVCNQEGHLKRVCPKLRGGSSLYNVTEEKVVYLDHSDSSDSDEVNNFSINSSESLECEPYTIDVNIAGKWLNMEIDTGSAISCISLECYKKLFTHCKIQRSHLVLNYYTDIKVKPVGKIIPNVQCNGISKELDLYVIENGKTSLLGRRWIRAFNIIDRSKLVCKQIVNVNKLFDETEFSSRYCEVFASGLGRFTGGTVGFHLRPDARPVFLRARPLAYALREPVERALEQMVRDGIITPVATSDWATPIVPVVKKDGTIRVCADFKLTLNKCLEVDHYPLPKVEDLLTKLHGGNKFTKLDLSQAYAQFELDESKKYTVINTHKGLFMYNRLIYGLASSPGIFQRKLEQLFADMPRVGVFLDDLIITGVDDRSHIDTLHEVFERLRKYGLRVKKDKCTFFADSVTYLGFVISKQGVHTCPEKIEAIKQVPVPNNVAELRSFLGLVMYYAKFVPNISTILAPLYALLRKDVKYEWSDTCMGAFNEVKQMLISGDILAHYSPDLPLILTTDASSVGVGAVISHLVPGAGDASATERPIAYSSRVLNAAEKSYSQIEREALSIIYGVRKFHQYLYGRRFILRTDHKPLVTIFGDKVGVPVMAASRMQRWAVILAGYDYTIEYVRSDGNAADALSRLPVGKEKSQRKEVTYLNFIQNFLPITRKMVQDNVSKDEVLKKIFLFLLSGWPTSCDDDALKPYYLRRNELYIDRGCIIWGYRLVVPEALRNHLLKELHVGHLGIVKMKSLARSVMWWPGIDRDIEELGKQCTTCALEGAAPPRAPPQPWPYNPEPWSRLHIDFLGPFQGETFLVIIDSATKWLEIFKMAKTTARGVIKSLRETFARFGLPLEIVSDNGPPFTSKEYANFMENNGIKLTFTPAYHPASNGAAENAVKLCKRAIKKALRDGCDVDEALQAYLMMYRNVEHSSTGSTPAMLLQRRRLRSRLDLLRGTRQVESRVHQAQDKQVFNAGGKPRELNVGDSVWARDHAGGSWLSGQVKEKVGSRNFIIARESGPQLKRHLDQIKRRRSSYTVNLSDGSEAAPGGESAINETEAAQTSRAPEPVVESDLKEPPQPSIDTVSLNTVPSHTECNESPADRPKRIRKPVQRYGFEFD
ncbi:uncharacterized protein K02A2.6-like [Cydia amplana]|uniref:uncharacterized protein K02A2.6-like n=1 Tax=Cydia amplana TaxID=1869771 RepID=UPI002FE66C0F